MVIRHFGGTATQADVVWDKYGNLSLQNAGTTTYSWRAINKFQSQEIGNLYPEALTMTAVVYQIEHNGPVYARWDEAAHALVVRGYDTAGSGSLYWINPEDGLAHKSSWAWFHQLTYDHHWNYSIFYKGDLWVYRLYNVVNGSHFYTASVSERDSVLANYPTVYRYDGPAFKAYDSFDLGGSVYRFYNVINGSHFYTASPSERDSVLANYPTVYRYDGPAFRIPWAPNEDTGTVYRFYNRNSNSHFYTASPSERDYIIATYPTIFSYEGVAWYVPAR